RQLLNLLVADHVRATITDTSNVKLVPLPPEGHHHRRAHVLHVFVEGTHRHDFFVRLDDGPTRDVLHPIIIEVRREILPELAGDDFDRSPTRDFTGRLPAHTVCHDHHG